MTETRKLAQNSLNELNRTNFPVRVHFAAENVTPEDLKYEGYWGPLSGTWKFHPWDRLEVRAHDRSWRVELTVLAVTSNGLTVHFDKLSRFKIDATADDSDGVYTISNRGGQFPWWIIRDRDDYKMGEYVNLTQAKHERALLHPKRDVVRSGTPVQTDPTMVA